MCSFICNNVLLSIDVAAIKFAQIFIVATGATMIFAALTMGNMSKAPNCGKASFFVGCVGFAATGVLA